MATKFNKTEEFNRVVELAGVERELTFEVGKMVLNSREYQETFVISVDYFETALDAWCARANEDPRDNIADYLYKTAPEIVKRTLESIIEERGLTFNYFIFNDMVNDGDSVAIQAVCSMPI